MKKPRKAKACNQGTPGENNGEADQASDAGTILISAGFMMVVVNGGHQMPGDLSPSGIGTTPRQISWRHTQRGC